MSWLFDRPDFLARESHSGCRASGLDGRFFPPPEVTPLIMVFQASRARHSDAVRAFHLRKVPLDFWA